MKRIKIVGIPIDLGAGRRGVDMGVSALRIAGLAEGLRRLDYSVEDIGDILVPIPEVCSLGEKNARYQSEIRRICENLWRIIADIIKDGAIPLTIGGDHSLAIGSIAGVSDYYRLEGKKIGVLWFDAHGDMNTPESTNSGNVHGMPFAVTLGLGAKELTEIGGFSPKVKSRNAALIGVRNLDEREKKLIADSGIKVYTMKEIDERGMGMVVEEALQIISEGVASIHVSFDIDVVDPAIAPGVGTPVKGGLNYRESHLAMEIVSDSGLLHSMDMVEVNPVLDNKNSTAELAAELIQSAFGKRIF